MRRRNLRVDEEPAIMIIPMIDIVFFLLVFFMISTLYMNTEQQIPLSLPKAASSSAKTIEPVSVTLTKEGRVFIGKDAVKAEELQGKISGMLAQNNAQAFVIRADEGIAYGKVIDALNALKLAGASHVSVATERK